VFRAGRRARVKGLKAWGDSSGITCEATHDGFRSLRGHPRHRRRWSLTEDGLRVDDTVTGRGRHEIVVRWQLAAGTAVEVADATVFVTTPAGAFSVAIEATGPVSVAVETRPVATGFCSTTDAPVLSCRAHAVLPVHFTTVWSRAPGNAGEKGNT